MEQNELYINANTGAIVTKNQRRAAVMLVKLLYRLEVTNEHQALKLIAKFRILFV